MLNSGVPVYCSMTVLDTACHGSDLGSQVPGKAEINGLKPKAKTAPVLSRIG